MIKKKKGQSNESTDRPASSKLVAVAPTIAETLVRRANAYSNSSVHRWLQAPEKFTLAAQFSLSPWPGMTAATAATVKWIGKCRQLVGSQTPFAGVCALYRGHVRRRDGQKLVGAFATVLFEVPLEASQVLSASLPMMLGPELSCKAHDILVDGAITAASDDIANYAVEILAINDVAFAGKFDGNLDRARWHQEFRMRGVTERTLLIGADAVYPPKRAAEVWHRVAGELPANCIGIR